MFYLRTYYLIPGVPWPTLTYFLFLTFPVPIPEAERKLIQVFIFTLLCGDSKGFMKALKAFIKSFKAPQRNVKMKNLS